MAASSYNNSNVNSSFYDRVSNSYSDSLSVEIAELQRTIFLPLLPMERLTYSVLAAYEDEGLPYWFKDEVYTSVLGNFYVPMLFPMVENPEESTDMVHPAPENGHVIQDDPEREPYTTEEYTTRTYVELIIPKYIVMNFTDTIPKGTKFIVGYVGGSNTIDSMKILSVAQLNDEELDINYAEMGPNEPNENRGKDGEKSGGIENKKALRSTRNVGSGTSTGAAATTKAKVSSKTNNSAGSQTGVSSSTRSSGSSTRAVAAPNTFAAPSPFSTLIDLSGLNMATVKKKVHEDLELIKQETIRRQAYNARREIINER
jgi:hypothetical protein